MWTDAGPRSLGRCRRHTKPCVSAVGGSSESPRAGYSSECVEKLFGNSELIPNRGYEAAKRGQRSPDRLPLGAKEECSRHLLLFSKQFRKVNSTKLNFRFTEFSEVQPRRWGMGGDTAPFFLRST